MTALTGNEVVEVLPVQSNGRPSGVSEFVTTQQIANLGGGGGGGGTETGIVISTGGTYNLGSVTAGSPTNYVVTTTSNVTINIPSPNAGTPWGRVNISGQSGNPSVTIVPGSGLINGGATALINTAYGSSNLLDFGTGWAIQ